MSYMDSLYYEEVAIFMIHVVSAVKDSCHSLRIFASNLCVMRNDFNSWTWWYETHDILRLLFPFNYPISVRPQRLRSAYQYLTLHSIDPMLQLSHAVVEMRLSWTLVVGITCCKATQN